MNIKTVPSLKNRPKFNDEFVPTASSDAQKEVERNIELIYSRFENARGFDGNSVKMKLLRREEHIAYLEKKLTRLPSSFGKLDSSLPWICYWTLQSLALLHHEVDKSLKRAIVEFLKRCQNESGGFGGGPFQYSHLATTYAAINALVILGTTDALKAIDRDNLQKYLWSLRVGDGSFQMHVGGEVDIRSVYCALSMAKILNLYSDELFENSVDWIVRCQTYEGGFSGEPGLEAHGGYTFCAVAALVLLNSYHRCDIKSLLRWTVNRQMKFEGGFQGRTNKLVDSCYSFWQGASLTMANMTLLAEKGIDRPNCESWLFDNQLLQEYVLISCQHPQGGFMDKPNVHCDPYHSCYALSGLSISQDLKMGSDKMDENNENTLAVVHPAYNLPVDKLNEAFDFYYGSSVSNSFVKET